VLTKLLLSGSQIDACNAYLESLTDSDEKAMGYILMSEFDKAKRTALVLTGCDWNATSRMLAKACSTAEMIPIYGWFLSNINMQIHGCVVQTKSELFQYVSTNDLTSMPLFSTRYPQTKNAAIPSGYIAELIKRNLWRYIDIAANYNVENVMGADDVEEAIKIAKPEALIVLITSYNLDCTSLSDQQIEDVGKSAPKPRV
jgi:hypothetical protein